jgi:hypothetical protein
VTGLNAEEERDNERKFREEQLIAGMEDQLYLKQAATKLPVTSSTGNSRVPQTLAKKEELSLQNLSRQAPDPLKTYCPELTLADKSISLKSKLTGISMGGIIRFVNYVKMNNNSSIGNGRPIFIQGPTSLQTHYLLIPN